MWPIVSNEHCISAYCILKMVSQNLGELCSLTLVFLHPVVQMVQANIEGDLIKH